MTAKDFAGQPDPERRQKGISAFTTCEMKWNFRFEFRPTDQGVAARVTRIDIAMNVVPEKSWNVAPEDAALLDHEQGHFDVWRIHELRALKAAKKREGFRELAVAAKSMDEAKKKLEEAVTAWVKLFTDASREENIEYDRVTSNGVNADKQKELRRIQQETLKALAASKP